MDVQVFSAAGQNLVQSLKGFGWHGDYERAAIRWSSDGKQILASSQDGMVCWEVVTGKEQFRATRMNIAHIGRAGFHADNGSVIDAQLNVYDTSSGKVTGSFPARPFDHITNPKPVPAISPDGRYLAACEETEILIYDIAKRELIRRLHGHTGTVCALAFSRDGKYLASGGADRLIKIWDAKLATASLKP